jgi:chromosome segregation ATPase
MIRIPCFAIALLALLAHVIAAPARAQDVQGIELCTRESSADRRIGCLQSNIQYLHGLIGKTTADAQQKLGAAASEIGALKGEIAALKNEVAALKAALAAEHAGIEKLQAALARRAPAEKPASDKPAAEKPAAK